MSEERPIGECNEGHSGWNKERKSEEETVRGGRTRHEDPRTGTSGCKSASDVETAADIDQSHQRGIRVGFWEEVTKPCDRDKRLMNVTE